MKINVGNSDSFFLVGCSGEGNSPECAFYSILRIQRSTNDPKCHTHSWPDGLAKKHQFSHRLLKKTFFGLERKWQQN